MMFVENTISLNLISDKPKNFKKFYTRFSFFVCEKCGKVFSKKNDILFRFKTDFSEN